MVKAIIFLVIGVIILAGGLYYLNQDKDDAESRKIYGIVSAVGAVITIVGVVMLVTGQ